jgi:hypothetical protein
VPNIVVLNRSSHGDVRVKAGASAALGDAERFVQVVIREFPLLAVHYPILFSKDSETGAFFCGAMLGFDPGENLFLGADGTGQASYRPLNLQRAPFFAAGDGLAIDLDSPRVSRTEGEALFGPDGEPTPYLESIAAVFRELRPGIEMTRIFIDHLLRLGLIEPIDIDLSFDDGESRSLQGLYTINQDELRELSDEVVLDLFRRGYLQLIYLMIASLKQIPVLARVKNDRLLHGSGGLAGTLR